MTTLTSAQRATIQKYALKAGVTTAEWSDEQFIKYGTENNLSCMKPKKDVRTNSKSTKTAEKKVEKKVEIKQEGGRVESAIADLVAGLAANQDLDEERVVALIKEHSAPTLTTVEVKSKGKVVATIEGAHKETPTVMAHIAAGVNIACVGPAGSGKSTMFKQIADSLKLDYYITGAVQQEHKVLGYMDANGEYHRTPFRDAFENGGMFVFEEFDGSGARALLAINNATANEYTDFPDGMVKRHPDFICVMAGNTYGTGASRQYVGRQKLDDATLDRFAFLEIGYDFTLERACALAEFDGAGDWVDTVQSFRNKVERAGLRHVVSPRASIMGAKLLKQGVDKQVAIKTLLHKGLSQDQLAQIA